jgi:phosphatidylglycerophosphate synthase
MLSANISGFSVGKKLLSQRAVRRWAADAVSFSRLALLVPLVGWEVSGSPWALAALAAIVLSDLVDGAIARRLGTAGSRGAMIDATCDGLVAMNAALGAGLSDARYAGLAAVMAVAFLSYGAFSLIVRRFGCTRLGRYDSAVCYGVIAVACAKPALAAFGAMVPSRAEWALLGVAAILLAVSAAENIAGIATAADQQGRAGV